MKRVAILIDAGFMKKRVQNTKAFDYNATEIVKYCQKHINGNNELYRIFYYDAFPSDANGHNPISQDAIDFGRTPVARTQNELFNKLKKQDHVALRLEHLAWPGNSWQFTQKASKALMKGRMTLNNLTDNDVKPGFVQKGVDMRIGLDIASLSYKKLVQCIVVITCDRDFIPALKLARKEGLIVRLDAMKQIPPLDLQEHVDVLKTHVT